jgi:hypothetical protein
MQIVEWVDRRHYIAYDDGTTLFEEKASDDTKLWNELTAAITSPLMMGQHFLKKRPVMMRQHFLKERPVKPSSLDI